MINPEVANTVDRLIDLAGHTEIIKHVPGQIQLRIKPKGVLLALNLNLNLLNLLQVSIRGILGAKADITNRTVVINYDEKVLPMELWELLIKSHASPKIQQLVKRELLSRASTG